MVSASTLSECFSESSSTLLITSPLVGAFGVPANSRRSLRVRGAFPVEAALLDLVLRFPPPAAGAFVLARDCGAGARFAADRCVPALVQRVIWEVVLLDVRPNLVSGPRGQRRDLRQALVLPVGRDDESMRARRRLLAADTGDPRVVAMQRPREGPRLPDIAAQPPQVGRLVKQVDAMAADHLGQIAGVGRDHLDLDRVAIANAVDHVVRLLWQGG